MLFVGLFVKHGANSIMSRAEKISLPPPLGKELIERFGLIFCTLILVVLVIEIISPIPA
jgi:hypothetical protein